MTKPGVRKGDLFQGNFLRTVEKAFRPSDVYAMALALLEKERTAAQERTILGNRLGGSASPHDKAAQRARRAKISRDLSARATDRIGRHFGMSGRNLEKIFDVCRAAEADPDRFGGLLEEMDRTGKVNGPHTKLLRLRDEMRVRTLVPVTGTFHTTVMDVPWEEDNVSSACGHTYATMNLEAILALRDQVDAWAAADFSHLWFWVKNNTVGLGYRIIEHYGYVPKTIHTWHKSRWGRGRYARNNSEHVIFATRGDQGCAQAFMSTPTCHDDWWVPDGAPESTKPDGFYDMVRALSFGPYGEAFQRTPRSDFVNLFEQAPATLGVAAE